MTAHDEQARTPWSALAQGTTRRARRIVLVAAAVGIIAVICVSRLRPVASIGAMLDGDQPAVRALERISDHFAAMEELIVLASLPDDANANDADAGADRLSAFARRLASLVASSPVLSNMCRGVLYRPSPSMRSFVEEVVLPNATLYGDDRMIDALAARFDPVQMREQIDRAEERLSLPGASGALARAATKDPLALREILVTALPSDRLGGASEAGFFSADRRHLLIRLRGVEPASDLAFANAFTRGVARGADEANETGLDLAYAGSYAIAAAAQTAIRRDMITSIVLSIVFLQVLYLLVYRSMWVLPAALAPVALGIVVGFGAFWALGMNLTPITAVIGAVLAGLGIDYSIHLLSYYRKDRVDGLMHEDAVRATLTDIGPALIAACVTTIVGFLAISQSSVRALREFGWLGAMGLAASLLAALFVLPAILTLTVGRKGSVQRPQRGGGPIAGALMRHAACHSRIFLLMGAVAATVSLAALATLPGGSPLFEDDLSVMHPRPNQPLETQHRIAELFQASPESLFIHLHADTPDALVALAHRVDDRLHVIEDAHPNLVGSFGLASLLPDPRAVDDRREALKRFHADRVVSDFKDAVAESALNPTAFAGYEDYLRRLISPQRAPSLAELRRYPGLAETVLPETGTATQEAVTIVLTAHALADRTSRDDAIETIRAALVGEPDAVLTGMTVIGHDTERTIRHDLVRLLAVALGIVILWLMAYFRSVRAAALALVPVAFGFVVMLAWMRITGMKLNTVNVIALPLLVGIGVDDGIFLVSIARKAPIGSDGFGNLAARLGAGCHAIIMTSLTTVLTFGTLAFTSTPAISSLGEVMAIGVSASLAGAIWILVPVLTIPRGERN